MAFQVQGKLYKTFDIEKKTETFQAREFILEISESQYPQLIKFQLTQDKCELIDAYQDGEMLTVHFDLRGREWNDRFFTNLNAWKIERGQGSDQGGDQGGSISDSSNTSARAGGTSNHAGADAGSATKTSDLDFDDDIPF